MGTTLTDAQHRNISFWGLTMIAMGLPVSIFLVNVGIFTLAAGWLLENQRIKRLKQFFTSPLALAITSIFFIHVAGLAWTQDLEQGLKEVRVKLPLLILPLLLFTIKLPNRKRLHEILLLFVVACIVGTLFGTARYFEVFGGELLNKRHISVFISHIRFGLMLILAEAILLYMLRLNWNRWSFTEKLISVLATLWIGWFLVVMEAMTAYIALAVVLLYTAVYGIWKIENRRMAIRIGISVLVLTALAVFYVSRIAENHFNEVPTNYLTQTVRTLNGNMYEHQKDVPYRENGHRVWNYVCWQELKSEWPKRSDFDFHGLDKRQQELKYTLVRYITSKGLMKDSTGVHQLSENDIRNIENGFTNYRYTTKLGVARRIDQMLWAMEEYGWNDNANNSSALQRWIYAKVGAEIVSENPLLGVGTGDVNSAYKAFYEKDDRGLEPRFQGISHNQFLTIAIALGVFGFVIFMVSLLYPAFFYRSDYLYVSFLLVMCVSFLTDNTFDRQSGVTMFAFFNAFLIIRKEFTEVKD